MKKNLAITSALGAIAIILGAFGAHALKEKLGVDALKSFETGVRYQMYHVIVLLFVNTYIDFSSKTKNTISWFFFIGILFFSGSLYAITAGGIDPKSIWFITPFGGLLLIIGWVLMLFNFIKNK
ncbi:MAG TPA: DUF423 domain-containing protein [Flavobacteriaceae bacterium]|jgi:uncharacterized membrane protein YgdD (TMEM256/DUF423 family)|nr:DUF423 domain-containing protein [Flavobacteriaceae bacterium]HBS13224.1 DUF423 domain-containing protein [Flavobacteriaceae bacterium]